jgi:hypothetical protein
MNASIFKLTGLVRLATIERVYPDTMTVDISFTNNMGSNSLRSKSRELFLAQLPMSYLSSGGGFIGGLPTEGTPVAVVQAESGHHYYIVSFLARDPAAKSTVSPRQINIPTLKKGSITIQAHPNTSIELNKNSITIGDLRNSVVYDTERDLTINSFSNSYTITEAGREIVGTILRDKNPQSNFSTSMRTTDVSFNSILKEVGLDPVAETTNSTYGAIARNPARIEKREVIFEYENIARIQNNDQELKGYNGLTSDSNKVTIVNRRDSRADTLSLSLVYPNHLMETIKGTVVDIYGNILDINRNKIPIGEDNFSIVKIKSTATSQNKNIYEDIKRLERRSLAYHFEINARKESQKSSPPNVSVRDNFARDRSRFFVDIDKEGQFKINVPASSSTGNIPLHTRYENYSTVFPNDKSKDPNDVALNEDRKDILIEKYLDKDPIKLLDENNGSIAPVDRFSNPKSPSYIGHGTVYHDITRVARHSSSVQTYVPGEYATTTLLDAGHIPTLEKIVSEEIIVSGPNANAGGRSGSMNLDGSLELNIGANEVDEQSLWLDTEGGIISSVGQDKNGISVAASLDGNVILELGTSDKSDSNIKDKIFDLKVADGVGNMTVFRIDKSGLSVTTHGRYVVYSTGDMMFRSAARITMDAEHVVINGRSIIKEPGKGPVR